MLTITILDININITMMKIIMITIQVSPALYQDFDAIGSCRCPGGGAHGSSTAAPARRQCPRPTAVLAARPERRAVAAGACAPYDPRPAGRLQPDVPDRPGVPPVHRVFCRGRGRLQATRVALPPGGSAGARSSLASGVMTAWMCACDSRGQSCIRITSGIAACPSIFA